MKRGIELTEQEAATVRIILDEWCAATALPTRDVRSVIRKIDRATKAARAAEERAALVLYPRDATWHPHGKRGGGRRGVYHRPSAADEALARCSRNIVLNDDAGVAIGALDPVLVCRSCVP